MGPMLGSGMWRGACIALGEPYGRPFCKLPFMVGCEYLECSDPWGESARSIGIWGSCW